MEKVIFELPEQGRLSWVTVERCAREANMPVETWIVDAIETKMRRQDTVSYCAQHELWKPSPQEEPHIPYIKKQLGNALQKLADRLWDSIDADLPKVHNKEV